MNLSCGPWTYNRFDLYEKKLDPVGKEDADVNNDGKVDSSDSYLKKRRAAIGKAIGKKDIKESCDPKCDCDKCKGSKSEKSDKKGDKKMPPWLKDKKEVKEQIIQTLMDEGLANNPVSAEIIAEHMSEEWVESILEGKNYIPGAKFDVKVKKGPGYTKVDGTKN